MKSYQKILENTEAYLSLTKRKVRPNDTQFQPTMKDGVLNRVLKNIEWLSRLPGNETIKKPYMTKMWDIYKAVQESSLDDNLINYTKEIVYSEDRPYSEGVSIADSGIGTGGLGYASVRSADMGTAFRKKPSDKYFRKYPKSKCRTLEGDEKKQAWAEFSRRK